MVTIKVIVLDEEDDSEVITNINIPEVSGQIINDCKISTEPVNINFNGKSFIPKITTTLVE